MENKIDQFFKDKLESHASAPSEEAWTKVEANLSKKNNAVAWRIAASILIVGALVSVIIWSQRGTKNNEQILVAKKSSKDNSIKENRATPNFRVEKKEEAKSFQKKSLTTIPQSVSSQTENKSSPRSVSSQTENNSDPKNEKENEIWSVRAQTIIAESVSTVEEKINTKATPPTIIASTKRKPIKLEFTLEDFSAEQPVATVSEEKNSGIKKVWELALEVKNGDGPVREIKNELFAHSFKKNKNQ